MGLGGEMRRLTAAQTDNALIGTVTSSEKGGVNVYGVGELRNLPLAAPYGVLGIPVAGDSAQVILNGGRLGSAVCVGVVTNAEADIQPGELYLFSKGGASIHLKNDGSIVLNKSFTIRPNGTAVGTIV